MVREILNFFDKFEDKVRHYLSRYPLVYAIVGGTAIVLFWKGVWETADLLGISGPGAVILSVVILLATGLFVSFFVGDSIIISGVKREKKIAERTELELQEESEIIESMKKILAHLDEDLEELKKRVKK